MKRRALLQSLLALIPLRIIPKQFAETWHWRTDLTAQEETFEFTGLTPRYWEVEKTLTDQEKDPLYWEKDPLLFEDFAAYADPVSFRKALARTEQQSDDSQS